MQVKDKLTMKAKMIYIGKERGRKRERERMTHEVKLDKTGAFVGKTHNSDKIIGEEKCTSETEDVRERQRTGERR